MHTNKSRTILLLHLRYLDRLLNIIQTQIKKSVLTGDMATFDVYSFPDVNRIDQLTSTSITVAHDNSPEFNSMLAGWMVSFEQPVRI